MRHLDNHEGQGLEDESANGQSFTQLWLWNEAFKKKIPEKSLSLSAPVDPTSPPESF